MPRTTEQPSAPNAPEGGSEGVARGQSPELGGVGLGGDDPVLQLVARSPVSLPSDATLRTLAHTMADESVGAVLLRGPEGLVGVVSERDIILSLADGADPDRQLAGEVMTSQLASVAASDTILTAANRMLGHDIRHLAVTKGSATIGMISIRDVLAVLADHPGDGGAHSP